MKHRLPFALLILSGTLAFAPAPLPRRERVPPDEITLDTLQGHYRVVRMQISRGGGDGLVPFPASYTHVRVAGRGWTFFNEQKAAVTTFMGLDEEKRPAQVSFYDDFSRTGAVTGVGLVRRVSGQVQVAYRWGDERDRPTTFDDLANGVWIVTLERLY